MVAPASASIPGVICMRIKILRATVADGQPVDADVEIEVSEATARTLINLGKAEQAKPKPHKASKDAGE